MSTLSLTEQLKYDKVWGIEAYRKVSPALYAVEEFLQWIDNGSVIDFGCGTGRASLLISGYNPVTMVDISEYCLDPEIINNLSPNLEFKQQCLWELDIPSADYGFCCDVMEHIPEEKVDKVLSNISNHVNDCYFRIFLHKDNGKFIDEPLHLTVRPKEWWHVKISKLFNSVIMKSNGTVATIYARKHDLS